MVEPDPPVEPPEGADADSRGDDDIDDDVDAGADSNADAVSRGVELFLDLLLADPLLNWAFVDVDAALRHRYALAFVFAALGGPDRYLRLGLREVHAPLKFRDEHFDAAVVHLGVALREAGISPGVIADLPARLEPIRSQIVTAHS